VLGLLGLQEGTRRLGFLGAVKVCPKHTVCAKFDETFIFDFTGFFLFWNLFQIGTFRMAKIKKIHRFRILFCPHHFSWLFLFLHEGDLIIYFLLLFINSDKREASLG
jgi:hypothetical protein